MNARAVVVDVMKKLQEQNRLSELSISESGFVFDSVSGHSFDVNQTGSQILNLLIQNQSFSQIAVSLQADYQIPQYQAEQALSQFLMQLEQVLA